MSSRVAFIVVLSLTASCTEDEASLFIDVRTDLVPTREFTRAVIDPDPSEEGDEIVTEVVEGQDWLSGVRVLEQEGLEQGTFRLEVRLEGNGPPLVRGVSVELDGALAVTVVMTRDCLARSCPDSPEGYAGACIAGQCVEQECTIQNPAACNDPICSTDTDCSTSSACGDPACDMGVCLIAPDATVCAADEICDLDLGCARRSRGTLPTVAWVYRPLRGGGLFRDVAFDAAGNVFVVGRALAPDFGGGVLGGSDQDPIVLSLDSAGSYRWGRVIVADGDGDTFFRQDFGFGVTVEPVSGDVVMTGAVTGAADFGMGMTAGATVADLFVASYAAADGAPRWARRFGADNRAGGRDIVPDTLGGLFVSGAFGGSVDFDGSVLSTTDPRDLDGVVLLMDGAGTVQLTTSFGDNNGDSANAMSVGIGELLVTGSFDGDGDLGGGPLGGDNQPQLFAAVLDPTDLSHTSSWNTADSDGGISRGLSIATDSMRNVYVVGTYQAEQTVAGSTFRAFGFDNSWLISFDPAGAIRWFRQWGLSPHSDEASAVVVDGNDNVWITGSFERVSDFGGGPVYAEGADDGYVTSYDIDGNHRFSWVFGAPERTEAGYGLGVAPDGSVVLVGQAGVDTDFGMGPVGIDGPVVVKLNP